MNNAKMHAVTTEKGGVKRRHYWSSRKKEAEINSAAWENSFVEEIWVPRDRVGLMNFLNDNCTEAEEI